MNSKTAEAPRVDLNRVRISNAKRTLHGPKGQPYSQDTWRNRANRLIEQGKLVDGGCRRKQLDAFAERVATQDMVRWIHAQVKTAGFFAAIHR